MPFRQKPFADRTTSNPHRLSKMRNAPQPLAREGRQFGTQGADITRAALVEPGGGLGCVLISYRGGRTYQPAGCAVPPPYWAAFRPIGFFTPVGVRVPTPLLSMDRPEIMLALCQFQRDLLNRPVVSSCY